MGSPAWSDEYELNKIAVVASHRLACRFGEDQARYIVTVPAEQAGLVLAKLKGCGVPCVRIGSTRGDAIAIAGETPVLVRRSRPASRVGFRPT